MSATVAMFGEIDQANELIKTAIQNFGKLDILINNVGISMRGDVADLNPEVFKTVFDSNVLGLLCSNYSSNQRT